MKLAIFQHNNQKYVGLVEGDSITKISQDEAIHAMPQCLANYNNASGQIENLKTYEQFPLASVKLCAPVLAPRKCLGIGGNTRSHLEESKSFRKNKGMPDNNHQVWFNKQVTCINGPYDPIHKPRISDQLDYEGEMVIVIGKIARNVTYEQAKHVIAGFTVGNDVSVRDWQLRAPTATLGKSWDTHGPIGPWIVTADEIENPHHLAIKTWVNGSLRQNGSTEEFIYDCYEMIVELSTVFTLEPGDCLFTGSPAGVGALMNPPHFLKVGDKVRVEIEQIGAIENEIILAP